MNNSDMPAIPNIEKINPDVIAQAKSVGNIIKHEIRHQGLTKREYFAVRAMQGMLSTRDYIGVEFAEPCAAFAVDYADALLAELEK